MADKPLRKDEIFETLRMLADLAVPLWLAGGLAADFHVGRWTREHDDIDLVTFAEHRDDLEHGLADLGFVLTHDDTWITRYTRARRDVGEAAIAWMRHDDDTTGSLVITPEGSRGGRIVAGIYPGVPSNLDPARFRTIEDVTFRVVSAEDEWVFTKSFATMHPGAEPGPTDVHNVALLESVLTPRDLERLRLFVGRRLPLEEVDA